MPVDMTDPAAVRKFLESVGGVANSVPAPAAPTTPSPSYGVPQPSPVPAPSYGAPAPPKDMSGFKSSLPTFGMPPVPASNPVPAPAATTNATGGVSGNLTPDQIKIYMQLPDTAKNGYLQSLGSSGGATPPMPTGTAQPPKTAMGSYPTTPNVPAPAGGAYPTMTPEQIRAEVAAKIAAETAKRATATSQAKTGIQTSFDRLKATTNDTRTLENVQNARNLNPFSGRSDYAQGMIGREREITDRQQQEDLATRLANIDVSFKDYVDATPEQQRALENEAIRQERAYALQVDQLGLQQAQLTGNYGGSRTIAGQTFDQNVAQDKITNDRNTANDALALRKQHIDEANYYSDKYGITVEPKDDFQEVINQVKGLPTAAQQSAAQKADSDQRSEAWKVVETLGYVPQGYEKILGIPAGTQTQKAKEAAMDTAYKNRTAGISQQQADASTKNANTAAIKAEDEANKPKPIDKNKFEAEVVTNLDKMTPEMKKKALANEKAAIIENIGLSGYNSIYSKYFDEYGDPK